MSNQFSGRLIFGPSHIVRLGHALATGQLPKLSVPSRLVGVGGMPIWSPRIGKELAASASGQDAFFIVGDFRFGNAVLKNPAFQPDAQQEKEYLAIDKALINEENDKILFNLCLSALASLKTRLNGRLRLLFWDLSIRECQNRATGRYQESGVYRHPVWNLHDTLAQFADVAIDSRAILDYGERLYIDSSAHPSFIGWLYITQCLRGDTEVDLPDTISTFERALKRLWDKLIVTDSVLITGHSKFTRLVELFIQKQQLQLPPNWVIRPHAKAGDTEAFEHCLYFPALCTYELNEAEIAEGIERVRKFHAGLAAKHKKVSILYYDNWAYEAISKRKDCLNKFVSKHSNGLTASLEQATCPPNQSYKLSDSCKFEGMVELNSTLIPTMLGIVEIFCRSTTALGHDQITAAYSDFLDGCYS